MKEILYIVFFSVTTQVSIPCENSTEYVTDPITGERISTGMTLAIACMKDVTETHTRQLNEEDFTTWKKNADHPFSRVKIIRLEKLEICSRDTLVGGGG